MESCPWKPGKIAFAMVDRTGWRIAALKRALPSFPRKRGSRAVVSLVALDSRFRGNDERRE